MRAAIFDMDKTLVRHNTARLFTRYRRKNGEVGWAYSLRVGLWLAQYSLGRLNAPEVARQALREFKGRPEEDLRKQCEDWFPNYVLPHITDIARKTVEEHRKQSDVLVVATSATRYGTLPLLRELRMDHLVCSELQAEDGKLTGEVSGPICYGEGKLFKVRDLLTRLGLSLAEATFYSDSITDLPLLSAVAHPVAVNPDIKLLREAKRRGWDVRYWL